MGQHGYCFENFTSRYRTIEQMVRTKQAHERPRAEKPPASSWPPRQHEKPPRALAESRNRIAIARERSHCAKYATSKSRRSSSSTRRVLHESYVSVRQRSVSSATL